MLSLTYLAGLQHCKYDIAKRSKSESGSSNNSVKTEYTQPPAMPFLRQRSSFDTESRQSLNPNSPTLSDQKRYLRRPSFDNTARRPSFSGTSYKSPFQTQDSSADSISNASCAGFLIMSLPGLMGRRAKKRFFMLTQTRMIYCKTRLGKSYSGA
jgi:hypothetical protein